MRLALDGLPRDLPLSRDERRRLREAIRTSLLSPPHRVPVWVAFIPALTGAAVFGVVFTIIQFAQPRIFWTGAALLPMVVLQFWLTRRLKFKAVWPYTCRAMAANGYEVCLRCAYPLKDAEGRQCPECGAERLSGAG